MLKQHEILFEPVKIGPVTAPNRFYAVPHATGHGHLQPNGSIALRAMKAEGGWGVVCMQMTEIAAGSDMASHPMDRIWDESDLPTHACLVEKVKQHGALAAIELAHGGMRARNMTSGLPVIGPSNLPVLRPEIPVQARAMNKKDIATFRASHKRAAIAAKNAGYDIVYVYAAHDLSLLSHFLSRRTNQRSDEYGGALKNRVRLLREVLEDTKDAVGDKCAVAIRFSVEEIGADLPLTHNGEGREVVEMLAELPDLWDVNIAGWSADSATARFAEEGFQTDFVSFVKQVTTKPVVGVGRFTSPDKMVSLIKNGVLDFIGAARPSIADPFLPNKIKQGRVEDIRECIGCNICVSSDAYGIPLRCTQNPTIAEEWQRNWHPEIIAPCKKIGNVLVVGAGPAGLECAWTLARAGHNVTLAEASQSLGGRVAKESKLPGLSTWQRVSDYREYQLQQQTNVAIYLDSELSADDIRSFDADHVVIATGATWRGDGVSSSRFTPIPNLEEVQLLTPDDIMNNVSVKGLVIVYDDDHFYMGSVLAEKLRSEGHEVHLVTPLPIISSWTDYTLEQTKIVRKLTSMGVKWSANRTLSGIKDDEASFDCSFTGDAKETIKFSTFVMVGARTPSDSLFHELENDPGGKQVWSAGDCVTPGTIQAAVYSGHRTAKLINGDELAGAEFRRESARVL